MAPTPRLLLWHTFNTDETETLTSLLAGQPVQTVVVPFPRAFNTFRESVASGTGCPDVFRAEQTWVPALEAAGLLDRRADGRVALPHSIDGLALLYNKQWVEKPPTSIDELIRVAQAQTRDGRYGFFVRGDAYWFLPFLYSAGGDLAAIDSPEAVRALETYRSLLQYAPPPTANDYAEQQRRFGAGQVAMILNGPWSIAEILRSPAFAGHPERLGIAPLPATPISGHAWVVPRCVRDKAAAWSLAEKLASPTMQAELARRNGLVPANPDVAVNSPIVTAFRVALANGRPKPAKPWAVYLFDDFTPAVHAVLRGDAEPQEALAGVARSWRRLIPGPLREAQGGSR